MSFPQLLDLFILLGEVRVKNVRVCFQILYFMHVVSNPSRVPHCTKVIYKRET